MLRKLFGFSQKGIPAPISESDVVAENPLEAVPEITFDDKMQNYAAKARKTDSMLNDAPCLAAIKPAAQAGDLAFLREAAIRYPDIFARDDYWVTKDALNIAIEKRYPNIVRFFLQDMGVSPDYQQPESETLPQWDALMVAVIGHEPYTLGKMASDYKGAADQGAVDPVDEEIFDLVLGAYKEKYKGNAAGLARALTKQFSMPTGKIYWNSSDYQDYRVQSTSRSYGSALSMAHQELFKDKIKGALREIEHDLDDLSKISVRASIMLD